MKLEIALAAAVLALAFGAEKASALDVPYTESFASGVSGWENNANDALSFQASGSYDAGSYASADFNYLGYTNAFGIGPVLFRANDSDNASGDAFVGNWVLGQVFSVSAWVYQTTGEDLTYYMRAATAANFPGGVFLNATTVASDTWTQLTWTIDPNAPVCIQEGPTSCATVLSNVGNLQFGTSFSPTLVATDQAFHMGIDQVVVVPEPGQALLFGSGLLGLAVMGRRRNNA
jgi:hypothetical protein